MKNNLFNLVASIKNGQLAKKAYIYSEKTPLCESILNVLWDEGFISSYRISLKRSKKLKIFLKYKNEKPGISSMKIISKPSLRVYYSVKQLWKLDSIKGVIFLSTNNGLMSSEECKKKSFGGEPFIVVR